MTSLNQYMKQQDAHAAREEAIIELSEKISDRLLGSKAFYQPGLLDCTFKKLDTSKSYWHIEDFIADVEIDSGYMKSMLKGDASSMMEDIQEKFEAFCMEAAEKSIDEEWRLEYEGMEY